MKMPKNFIMKIQNQMKIIRKVKDKVQLKRNLIQIKINQNNKNTKIIVKLYKVKKLNKNNKKKIYMMKYLKVSNKNILIKRISKIKINNKINIINKKIMINKKMKNNKIMNIIIMVIYKIGIMMIIIKIKNI